jgi:hypothetical protein
MDCHCFILYEYYMYCCIIFCCMTYFGGFPSREAAKIGVIYIYNIPQLTEERMTLYFLVMCNRGIYSNVFVD